MSDNEAMLILMSARVTFSPNCRSALLTVCNCRRCRTDRGLPVTPESEAAAAEIAKEADRRLAKAERRANRDSRRRLRRNQKKGGNR